jgi:thymidylate synthase (FAD)
MVKIVEPKVFLIGESQVNQEELDSFLAHINASQWNTDASSDVEKLVEIYGRGCYESWASEGHNRNISRVRRGNETYLSNIIKSQHGSVLEHSWLNFMICDISRIFSHELIRHRVGTAYSQESLRYVRTEELSFWVPTDLEILSTVDHSISISQAQNCAQILVESVKYLENRIEEATELFDLDNLKNFDLKKRLTTIIRRIAPEGMGTQIGFSCNIRTLRHLLELRTSPHAEEEIRVVFGKIGKIVAEKFPNLFFDYDIEEVDGHPYFKSLYPKI